VGVCSSRSPSRGGVQCPLDGNMVTILVRIFFLVGSAIRTGGWRWSLGVVVRFRELSLRGLTGICGLVVLQSGGEVRKSLSLGFELGPKCGGHIAHLLSKK
jgi:hypothetical protein